MTDSEKTRIFQKSAAKVDADRMGGNKSYKKAIIRGHTRNEGWVEEFANFTPGQIWECATGQDPYHGNPFPANDVRHYTFEFRRALS